MLGCLFRLVDKYMCATSQMSTYAKPVRPVEKTYYNLRSRRILKQTM